MPLGSRSKTGKSRAMKTKTGRKGKTMKVTSTIRVKKAKPQTRATILDVVNTLLNRKTETKYIGQWVTLPATSPLPTGVSPFTGPAWLQCFQSLGPGGTAWQIELPAMTQAAIASGVSASDITRIGNYIEPTAHRVKMTLRLAPGYVSTSEPSPSSLDAYTDIAQQVPLDVTAYIIYGYVKSMKTYQGTGAAAPTLVNGGVCVTAQNEAVRAYNNLLDNGDLTFRAFNGDPILAQLPLSDYVNMKVKKVHLRQGGGWINTAVGLSGQPAQTNTAADNTLSRQLTLKFKPPSKLNYKNSSDIYPENYAPVFAVGYVYNDAMGFISVPGANPGAIEYIAQAQMWFKDHQ